MLLHPHPDFGGNQYNNVVQALFDAYSANGIEAVRFDFGSADLDNAIADTTAAIDSVAGLGVPIVLSGYSYGADIAASVTDDRLAGWFLVAPPGRFGTAAAGTDPRPKLVAVPQHDQFGSGAPAGWTNTESFTVPGADHFLHGRTNVVADRAVEFVRTLAGR